MCATVAVNTHDPGNVSFLWRKELRENKDNNFFLSFFRLCKATGFWADTHKQYSAATKSGETFAEEIFYGNEDALDFLTEDEYRTMFK